MSILGTMLLASFAGAKDLDQLAQAVEAFAQASRWSEGLEDPRFLAGIDPEQQDLLRETYDAGAAEAVGDLRLQTVTTVEAVAVPEDDVLADILGAQPELVQLGAMGLARALRQAHETYAGRGNPLPDAVKVILSITFSREVLDSVRVVDTDAEGSLPAIINEVQTNFGEAVGGQSAVTIDDIIAFSEIPDLSSVDFWAHEIQHVMQYRQLGGIDAFAAAYTKDYRQLEGDANAVGKKAVIDAQNVLMVIHALNSNRLGSSTRHLDVAAVRRPCAASPGS